MSPFLYNICTLCLATLMVCGAMCLYRMFIGPRLADRAISLDTLAVVFIGIISVLCMMRQSALYFDAVWILTLVGFMGTAAFARYIEKGRVF